MANRDELLSLHQSLTQAILAAEEWPESYKSKPSTFRELLRLGSVLETSVAEYLHELSLRAVDYVDWSVLAADGVPSASDPIWDEEMQLLIAVLLPLILELQAVGLFAGEEEHGIPVDFTTLEESIMRSARRDTGALVRGITDTTRKLIRESVADSIALGENAHDATLRLMEHIDNPIRAVTIAQTEPVNAYQSGYYRYAKATGAISKEWDGLAGACKLCTPLIGKTIPIDEMFELSNGQEVMHPAGHPRCRCSLIYNYPE